jgi:putative membrane protein insertion efficiency factor
MTRILLAILEFYRRWISPAIHSLGQGGGCRFVPTCSEYASVAIATHGPLRGTGLAIWRLLRCHPFCRGGLDPVPLKNSTGSNNRANSHLPHEPLP